MDANNCTQSISVQTEKMPGLNLLQPACESSSCDTKVYPPEPFELRFRADDGKTGEKYYFHYWVKRLAGENHQILAFGVGQWRTEINCLIPGAYGNDELEIAIIRDLSEEAPLDLVNCPLKIKTTVACTQ